jgi:4-hydroxy-3-polyprenylbenzoate decarboxylase
MEIPVKHLKSLREYVDALRAIGEVVDVNARVDLNPEIGAICRRCYETGAPAPLFTNIPGTLPGSRVLGAPAGVSAQPGLYLARIALSLGLDPGASAKEIVERIAEARDRPPLPPRRAATGPCKENVILGDKIDLLQLPAPLLHDGDGGRFLNTFGVIVAQTPDKKWTNWSIARIMLVDERRMAGIVAPNQHIGMVRKMWSDLGKDMPFALALGAEPFVPFVGGMPLPAYADEADFAGAYFGEPIEVVACETADLEVPATSEIVVEGYLSQTETAPEGPMGEYAGYLWMSGPSPKPVYHATALTYRNEPILPISVAGEPPEDNHTAWGIPNAAEILWTLQRRGFRR